MPAEGQVGLTGCQGPHINAGVVDGIHSDAIAQEGAPGLALGGVHRNNGHAGSHGGIQRVPGLSNKPTDDLVNQGGLASAAGSGDAQNRGFWGKMVRPVGVEGLDEFFKKWGLVFGHRNAPSQGGVRPKTDLFSQGW